MAGSLRRYTMKIYGELELHTMDKKIVECSLVELRTLYDTYMVTYRTKADDYKIAVFYDKYGGQITDNDTEYFVDFDVCENQRIRNCIIEGIKNMPYKNYLTNVIECALMDRTLPTAKDEEDEVRRCMCALLPQLDIEVAQKIARKIVRKIYKEVM